MQVQLSYMDIKLGILNRTRIKKVSQILHLYIKILAAKTIFEGPGYQKLLKQRTGTEDYIDLSKNKLKYHSQK